MINIVKLTFILVVWSLVILFLTSKKKSNYEEFFNETSVNDMSNVTIPSSDEKGGTNELVLNFTPWGKTELGCVNRCIMYTINNFDYNSNELNKEDLEKNVQKYVVIVQAHVAVGTLEI